MRPSYHLNLFLSSLVIWMGLAAFHPRLFANQSIELAPGQLYTVEVVDPKDIFEVDAEVVAVHQTSNNQLELEAKKPGTTVVYYWSSGKLETLDITVKANTEKSPKGALYKTPKGRDIYTYETRSISGFSNRSFFEDPTYYHHLGVNIPFRRSGRVLGNTYFSHRGFDHFQLESFALESDIGRFNLTLGDFSAQASVQEGPVPINAGLRGFQLILNDSKKRSRDEAGYHRLKFFGGIEQPRESESTFGNQDSAQFYGTQFEITPKKNYFLSFAGFALKREFESGYTGGAVIEQLWKQTPTASLKIHYANIGGKSSALFRQVWAKKNIDLDASSRFTQSGFALLRNNGTLTDHHTYQYSLNASEKVLNGRLRLTQGFGQTFFVPTDPLVTPQKNNLNFGVGGSLDLTPRQKITLGYGFSKTHSETLGTILPWTLTFHSISASYDFRFPPNQNFTLFGFFQKNSCDGFCQEMSNLGAIARYNITKPHFMLIPTLSYNQDHNPARHQIFRAGADVSYIHEKFKISSNTYFRSDVTEGREGASFIECNLSADFMPTPRHVFGLSAYNTLQLTGQKSLNGNLELRYTLHFGRGMIGEPLHKFIARQLSVRGVEGVVFYDRNGNGQQDPDEKGIPGIAVSLDNKTRMVTNERGEYRFAKLSDGDHTVSVDPKDLPESMQATTTSFSAFNIGLKRKHSVTMGFGTPRAALEVVAFADNNNDGHYQFGIDLPAPSVGILVTQNGTTQKCAGGYNGYCKFDGLSSGPAMVKLDVSALPDELFPNVTQQEVEIPETGLARVEFAFGIERVLTGRVYFKKPQKSGADVDTPAGGVKLKIGKNLVVTDEKGQFVVRNLAPGDYTIYVLNPPENLKPANPEELILHVSGYAENVHKEILLK